jgi:integrative and conjugative element protein (TIGR02256 family)
MGKKKRRGSKGGRNTEPDIAGKRIHPEAAWARKTVVSHPSVASSVSFAEPIPDGGFIIKFNMNVALPSRARPKGESETGVRASEPIIFQFPPAYPYLAPLVLLRSDFNTSLPHIIPIISIDGQSCISPCIYDGPLNDLLHEEGDGLSEVLNQLSDWLDKAAINDLIDPEQGWEPIRRDYTSGWMVYDVSHFKEHVQDRQGSCMFVCNALVEASRNGKYYRGWVVDDKAVAVTPALIANSFDRYQLTLFGPLYRHLTVLVWGSSQSIIDRYLPENVGNFHQLCERAKNCGTYDALCSEITNIGWAFKEASLDLVEFPIFVVLCVRRPHHLIGDDSSLEFIPYLIECKAVDRISTLPASVFMIDEDSPVIPLGHRHKVNKKLLRRMSGLKESMDGGPIVHIGCGSVGSKIAMHLARSGQEPFVLIDKSLFSPHNVARHALVPPADIPGIPKAALLAGEISRLRLEAEPIIDDIIEICRGQSDNPNPLLKENRLVIESTGSVAVRDMLASLPDGHVKGRLLHAVLYAQGKVGIVAIEGRGRNPNVNDLVLRFYDECIDDADLRSFFSGEPSISRQEVGLGCGSETMVMPDTRVSLFASGMAQQALQILAEEDGGSEEGELWIGTLAKNEMGVSWKFLKAARTKVLRVTEQNLWEVRISDRVIRLMREEMDVWGETETGGVLMGRISLYNRCFNISRLIDAPPDSIRRKDSFILGVKGLRYKVQETQDRSGGVLTYLGTWHSHPKGGEPSPTDKVSLDRLTKLRFGTPAVGLIVTPSGFRVIVNEGRLT